MTEVLGTLLIVDDDVRISELFAQRLERRGYTVTVVTDGRSALEQIAQSDFDLVLLDILMPETDGIQVLKHLRHLKSRIQLPVIMTTAKDEPQDIIDALRQGANDYVTKPIDIEVLLRASGRMSS